jgi:ubiquinone/menaquinone biosynthesis C-methylase UbiE
MLPRILEPEVMDTPDDASDYDAMDHSTVNRVFAADFFASSPNLATIVLDVGTGTAQIPIVMCQMHATVKVLGIDLASEMLKLAQRNIDTAGLGHRVRVEQVNGRELPYADLEFSSVVSNSIIHHIPNPRDCFAEMVRVCDLGGTLFVRDLLRPNSKADLDAIVSKYAADANAHQRQLFADSLHASLTLDEVRAMVNELGFADDTVQPTSDRHWTFAATRQA